MQERQDQRDYPTVDDPSLSSALSSAGNVGKAVATLEPYIPRTSPTASPTWSASPPSPAWTCPSRCGSSSSCSRASPTWTAWHRWPSPPCGEICRIGSKNTVERWIGLASDVGILRKETGKGGKDRKSNSYTFLGASRDWAPLPVGRPDTNPSNSSE